MGGLHRKCGGTTVNVLFSALISFKMKMKKELYHMPCPRIAANYLQMALKASSCITKSKSCFLLPFSLALIVGMRTWGFHVLAVHHRHHLNYISPLFVQSEMEMGTIKGLLTPVLLPFYEIPYCQPAA